jgi:hypothetical protein
MHRLMDQSEQLHADRDTTVPIVHEVKPAYAAATCNTDEPWGERHVGRSDTVNGDITPVSEVHVGATTPVPTPAPTILPTKVEIEKRLEQRRDGMRRAVEAHKLAKKNGD